MSLLTVCRVIISDVDGRDSSPTFTHRIHGDGRRWLTEWLFEKTDAQFRYLVLIDKAFI
jgi:hypothetical protein